MKKYLIPSLLVLSLGIAGCSSPSSHGNSPMESRLETIKPGEQTRNDVLALLGTPSIVPSFEDDTWYYVGSKHVAKAFMLPQTVERKVVAVHFDEQGVVERVETLGLEDGDEITPVARKTPTRGREMTVIEQFIGNIGRFSKDGGTQP